MSTKRGWHPDVIDIFFCHDLYFLTMVGWENRSENVPSDAGSFHIIALDKEGAVGMGPQLAPAKKNKDG
jgi:hypothetical protein